MNDARTATPHIPAAQQAYHTLHDGILRLSYAPGMALSEKEISSQIGVSRQPVREAFIRLSQEGLLRIRPQIGTFVSRLNPAIIHEAAFARVALECALVRAAVDKADTADIAELRQIVEAHKAASTKNDYDRVYGLDTDFHIALLDISGYPGLWQMVSQARAHMSRLRYLSVLKLANTPNDAVAFHTSIIDSIEAGDSDEAARHMKAHIEQNLDYMDQLTEAIPEYFET